jgi:hypothetical protein
MPCLLERPGRQAGMSPELPGEVGLIGEPKSTGDERKLGVSRRNLPDRATKAVDGKEPFRRQSGRRPHPSLEGSPRLAEKRRKPADLELRRSERSVGVTRPISRLLCQVIQQPVEYLEDVRARWLAAQGLHQPSLAVGKRRPVDR